LAPGDKFAVETSEMAASSAPRADEMEAYERLLGAAMEGDGSLFAREDYVEEAWRIVDPVLAKETPIYEYGPNTWGPRETERVTPEGGWHNPIADPGNSSARQTGRLTAWGDRPIAHLRLLAQPAFRQ